MRIAVVAPARRLDPPVATRIAARVATGPLAGAVDLVVDPRCFAAHGHFAGDDRLRAAAVLEAANDPAIDAVWFARGGYGSGRLLEALADGLGPAARAKTYLGYSDTGFLLAALTALGCPRCAHGPMVADIARDGGELAVDRALGFLSGQDRTGLEPSVRIGGAPQLAFNLTVLRTLLGTRWMPRPDGAVLMLEDVGEYDYVVDRSMWQLARSGWLSRLAGVRIGRFGAPLANDIAFEHDQADAVRYWACQAGVPVLGPADIGHDAANRIVPFGTAAAWHHRPAAGHG